MSSFWVGKRKPGSSFRWFENHCPENGVWQECGVCVCVCVGVCVFVCVCVKLKGELKSKVLRSNDMSFVKGLVFTFPHYVLS